MLALLYLGTSGCDVLVGEVLSGHVEPVLVLVAADPRTLAAAAEDEGAGDDAAALAELVLARGLHRTREVLGRERASLAGVFQRTPEPGDLPVQGRVLEGPLEAGLPAALQEAGAPGLHASRDALEVLGQFGIDVAAALDDAGLDLEAR